MTLTPWPPSPETITLPSGHLLTLFDDANFVRPQGFGLIGGPVVDLAVPGQHLISRLEAQPSAVVLDTVAGAVDEGKAGPVQGLLNALAQVVLVIDSGLGIEIGAARFHNPLDIDRIEGGAARGGDGFLSFGGSGRQLAPGKGIDLVVVAENSEVGTAPRGVKEVVSSNTGQVAVPGD